MPYISPVLTALLSLSTLLGSAYVSNLLPQLASSIGQNFSLADYRAALAIARGGITVACVLLDQPCQYYPPSPSNGSSPAPSPSGSTGNRRPEDLVRYPLPLARLADPGFQTRTSLLELFPEVLFSGQPGSGQGGRRLAAAPPVPTNSTAAGGWTIFSTDSGVTVIHLTPLSNGQLLFLERPQNRELPPNIASVYNIYNNTWRYFPFTDSPFCAGHVQLATDAILLVGGDNIDLTGGFVDGRYNIRVFTGGASPSYNITAVMAPYQPSLSYDPSAGARWYPSLLTMTDGNVLIVGGQTTEGGGYNNVGFTFVNPSYQFYQLSNASITPARPMQLLQDTDPISLYPFTTVLPNGLIMVISGARTRFYRYTPGTLTNDTTTYPAIPDLPVPAMYPQTASIVLLPLEPPAYVPRILVVGGSPVDRAEPGTPATANTYLLDLSSPNPTWEVETMSARRIMPDATLLPDGTVFIANGADTGIAGGRPGGAGAANLLPGDPAQSAETYNISAPFGSRMSGLLASSGRDRLYHCVSWLTPNAEMLVTGSEATSDYTMQVFTPGYLRGTFARPVLGAPSTSNPAYGAAVTLPLSFLGGSAVPIGRAVLYRIGGATHSVHFDQRQVALVFTATPTTISVTVPANVNLCPPGQYSLFVVTTEGRPSQAVNIGVGGATVQAPYYEPVTTPILPNGLYTISTAGRTTCDNYLTVSNCSQGNVVQMGPNNGGAVFNLSLNIRSSKANTYNVAHYWRSGFCNSILGAQACGGGNSVFPYSTDTLSGRQQWTISAAPGGGYYVQVLVGREDCNPQTPYLTAAACGSPAVGMGPTASALTTWTLTPVATAPPKVPQPPFVPLLQNGTYRVSNLGRAACTNLVNTDLCAVGNGVFADSVAANFSLIEIPSAERSNTYQLRASARGACANYLSTGSCPGTAVDLFGDDDGSGRQQFIISQAPGGGYYLNVLNGRATCATFLSGQACGTSPFFTLTSEPAASRLQVWNLTALYIPPTVLFPSGSNLNISNVGRAACASYITPQTCAAGTGLALTPNSSALWQFNLLINAQNPNTYQLLAQNRLGQCSPYMSCAGCPANFLDIFGVDDQSGRQQFTFVPVENGFTIQVVSGRTGCATYVAAPSCASGSTALQFVTTVTSNLAVWNVGGRSSTPPAPPPPPPLPPAPAPPPSTAPFFANGQYQIQNLGRASCTNSQFLRAFSCPGNTSTVMGPGGTWTLTYLPNAPVPNTYNVQFAERLAASCAYTYLSSGRCPGNLVDLFNADDASGRQQWTFTQSGTGYYMTINQGRAGCATYLSASACASTGLTFTSAPDTSSLQLWSVVSPAPPAPPTQILADGNYYIKSVARANCTAFLGGVTCGNSSNAVSTYAAPDALGTQVWTLTYLPLAAQPNTYNIVNSGRPSCFNFLSAIGCQANFVDLFVRDDGSGRQQWQISAVTGGFTITMPNGRSGCATVLSTGACGTSGAPSFVTSNTGNGQQTWSISPVSPSSG